MYESSEYEEDSLDSSKNQTGTHVHCARPSVKDNFIGKSFYKGGVPRDVAAPSIEEETLSQEFEDILANELCDEDAHKAAEDKAIKELVGNARSAADLQTPSD